MKEREGEKEKGEKRRKGEKGKRRKGGKEKRRSLVSVSVAPSWDEEEVRSIAKTFQFR